MLHLTFGLNYGDLNILCVIKVFFLFLNVFKPLFLAFTPVQSAR